MGFHIKKVRKDSGEMIDFDMEKLRFSLSKSGASPIEIEEVMESMIPHVHEGMRTKNLYQLAFKNLKKVSGTFAARYSLKRALQELGPAGYYFEKWVSKFLTNLGYQTCDNQLIKGKAVTHEADVIAQRDNDVIWIECKFRNSMDSKISVTTPMYVLSRLTDICQDDYFLFNKKVKFNQGWLITNAYFTSDSIDFGEYYDLKLLSWDYPKGKSIKHLVDQMALYPVTCLTSISKKEKDYLLSQECILVKDLSERIELIDNQVFNRRNKSRIIKEVEELIIVQA